MALEMGKEAEKWRKSVFSRRKWEDKKLVSVGDEKPTNNVIEECIKILG